MGLCRRGVPTLGVYLISCYSVLCLFSYLLNTNEEKICKERGGVPSLARLDLYKCVGVAQYDVVVLLMGC